jgi:hypothetical protein
LKNDKFVIFGRSDGGEECFLTPDIKATECDFVFSYEGHQCRSILALLLELYGTLHVILDGAEI